MFYVYRITNTINGKIYIGKAKDAIKRLRVHIKIAKGGKEKYPRTFHAIHGAISKYGIENFSFEILYEVDTEKEAFDLEIKEIAYNRENDIQLYNLSDGGEGNSGWIHTEVSRKKMSIKRKGKKFSPEHKKALSEAQSGSKHPQFGKKQSIKWREGKSKLKADDVRNIKKLISQKVMQKDIGIMYGVCEDTISLISRGLIWKDVI